MNRRERSAAEIAPRIEQARDQLFGIAEDLTFFEALQDEFNQQTRGLAFQPRNQALWSVLLGARDHLVVRFGEWMLLTRNTTLFKPLENNVSLAALAVPVLTDDEVPARDPHLRQLLQNQLEAAHAHLFPDLAARRDAPTKQDIAKLAQRFWDELEPVKNDRDDNRAHPYRNPQQGPRAAMLSFAQLRQCVVWAEQLLRDMQLLVQRVGVSDLPTHSGERDDAQDICDMLLLGSARQIAVYTGVANSVRQSTGEYPYQMRERMYASLWASVPRGSSPFGDRLPETKEFREAWGFDHDTTAELGSNTKGRRT